MAITNLTGYTWTGNNTLNNSDYSYNVTFTRKGEVYETFDVSDTYMKYYDTTKVYDDDNGRGWVWDGYKTISFTGGDDVSNSSLITWLETNGTLTPTVTNLTGYTWVANNTLDYYLQQVEYEFDINFTSNSNSYSLMFLRQMTIGDPNETELYYDTTHVMKYGSWNNPAYKEIVISGGVDATNTEFIDWLEENGTLTPPAPPSIADKLQELIDVKQDIKEAIENKGADLTGVAFGGYAEKVLEISGGGGGPSIIELTQIEYNALETKDEDTYYLITSGHNVYVISFQGTLGGINEVIFSSISIEFSNGDIVSFSPSGPRWIEDVPKEYKTDLGSSKLMASGKYQVYDAGSLYLIKNVLKITFYHGSTSWYLDAFYGDITFTGDLISTSIADTIQPAGGTSNLVYKADRDIVIGSLEWQACISANSQVLMADRTYKALGDIEVGDEILSYDWDTMTLISNPVIYSGKDDESFYVPRFWRWTFSDGTIIENAFSHRFYNLEAKKFVYLEYWNIGDHTVKEDGSHPYLVSVEKIYENFHYARITGQYGTNYFANGLLTGDRHSPDNLIL